MRLLKAVAQFDGKHWPAKGNYRENVSCKFKRGEEEFTVYADPNTPYARALLKVRKGEERVLLIKTRTVKGEEKTTAKMLIAEYGAIHQIAAALAVDLGLEKPNQQAFIAAAAIYQKHG